MAAITNITQNKKTATKMKINSKLRSSQKYRQPHYKEIVILFQIGNILANRGSSKVPKEVIGGHRLSGGVKLGTCYAFPRPFNPPVTR